MISTRSPIRQLFSSSWAWYVFRTRTYFLYTGSIFDRTTSTTIVLFILSLFTRPITVRLKDCLRPLASSRTGTASPELTAGAAGAGFGAAFGAAGFGAGLTGAGTAARGAAFAAPG